MTTLAVDSPMTKVEGFRGSIPIIANDIVYEGALVGDNGSGYGRPLVAGDRFLGHAIKRVDNTVTGFTGAAGAAGDLNIPLFSGRYKMVVALAAAITDVGQPVYASDDATLSMVAAITTTANSFVGVITRYISATKVEIEFRPLEYDEFGNCKQREMKSLDYSAVLADSGKIIYVDTTTKIIAMDAIANNLSGFQLTVVNAIGGILIEVDPDGTEVMSGGCGLAAGTAGQKLSNTAATAKRGDFVKLAGNATGWSIIAMRGTWVMA